MKFILSIPSLRKYFAFVTMSLISASFLNVSAAPPAKVTICHKGKTTLSVTQGAVQSHLNHGDTMGACTPSKVTICHKGRTTLSVVQSAVQAHLAHGDTMGACNVTPSQSN